MSGCLTRLDPACCRAGRPGDGPSTGESAVFAFGWYVSSGGRRAQGRVLVVGRQGAQDDGDFAYGTTFLEGISAHFPRSNVSYYEGFGLDGRVDDLQEGMRRAAAADVVIACVGETQYAEKPGWVRGGISTRSFTQVQGS
jgi:hypothetical protein